MKSLLPLVLLTATLAACSSDKGEPQDGTQVNTEVSAPQPGLAPAALTVEDQPLMQEREQLMTALKDLHDRAEAGLKASRQRSTDANDPPEVQKAYQMQAEKLALVRERSGELIEKMTQITPEEWQSSGHKILAEVTDMKTWMAQNVKPGR